MYAETNVVSMPTREETIARMADPVPIENLEKANVREIVITEEDAKDDFAEKRIGASEYARQIVKLLSLGSPKEETFSLKRICEEWSTVSYTEKEAKGKDGETYTKVEEKERVLRMAALLSELEKINKAGEGAIMDVQVTFKSYR